jgi:phosphinothricin acetyltransferase
MATNITYIPISESDLTLVKHINDWYIINTTATYHTEPITFEQLKEVIYVNHPKYKAYLIYHNMVLAGYCHLSPYKKKIRIQQIR